MKEYIYAMFEESGALTIDEIILHIFVAFLLGLVIYLSYFFSHSGGVYSKKFNISVLTLTVLTATVMTVIGNNIALSLGMVGALSIIRFRTAVKDTRDTVYIFWTMIVGICCGVGDYIVAIAGSAMVFVILLFFGRIKNDNRMLIVIRGNRSLERNIEALIYEYFNARATLRVKNTTLDQIELIFEVSRRIYESADKKEKSVVEALYELKGINCVNVVAQNDEISS